LTGFDNTGYHAPMASQDITTVLLDLDGTLLPMDRDSFMESYLKAFAGKCLQIGLPVDRAMRALESGITAMIGNDGSMTNERRFWQAFSEIMQIDMQDHMDRFLDFYRQEFTLIAHETVTDPTAAHMVRFLKDHGYRVVLATTPVFPREGTLERMRWAGLDPSWFDMITTYEDFSFAKPSLGYYRQILERLGIEAAQCLMIGNDVEEDMVVRELGMQVFLVTDHLINRTGVDTSSFEKGSLSGAYAYCKKLGRMEVRS